MREITVDPAMRLAIVHDWLTTLGGAEKVLESLLTVFPAAPVYTLVYQPQVFEAHPVSRREIRTSFIDRLPLARRHYRWYLPLMPLAIEQLDLRGRDVVISASDAIGHGVLVGPHQLHINYIYTPARYAWRLYHQYLEETGLQSGIRSWFVRLGLHYLRLWDVAAAGRVDHFVAISNWVARDVWHTYRRRAAVIYPPVDVDKFSPYRPREDYYLTVSRLVPYKRISLIVEAFGRLDLPLVVIGSGPELDRLADDLPPNVALMGYQPDEVVRDMLERAKAFVHAAEEDFGIAPVEAQAAGCPVIAYRRGGVTETVEDGVTGIFFDEQTVESLEAAVRRFEEEKPVFEADRLRRSAARFAADRFQKEIAEFVDQKWSAFHNRKR